MTTDEMTLYIPTHRRDRQRTWEALSPYWRDRAWLVCHEDEGDRWEDQGYPVLVHGEQGIANVRQFILDQHIAVSENPLVMMDDDFIFARRRKDNPAKFERLASLPDPGAAFDEMMHQLSIALSMVPLAGISPRGGANRETSPFLMNARLNGVIALDPVTAAVENNFRFDTVDLMEDFDITLQFLTAGYPNLRVNSFTWDDAAGPNAPGGCSTYRSLERHGAAAEALKEKWPGLVRTVQRPGWNGEMKGTRTDVTVSWKKAYERGVAWRDLMGLDPYDEPLVV